MPNFLVIYVEYPDSPSAQAQYLGIGKRMAAPVSEWAKTPSIQPSLPAYAHLLWKQQHPVNVHHLGLVDGTIQPYVVSKPSGYYHYKYSKTGGPDNDVGWTTWGSSLPYETYGKYRYDNLIKELFASDYLQQHLDASQRWNTNIATVFDYLILIMPKLDYLDSPERITAQFTTIPVPTLPCLAGITRVNWLPYRDRHSTMIHEYIHNAFQGVSRSNILNAPFIRGFVDEIYYTSGTRPLLTMRNGCIMHDSNMCQFQAMAAASWGLTRLERRTTKTGDYIIKNRADSSDYLVIRSPRDVQQFMVLWTYHEDVSINKGNYYHSYPQSKGIWAQVIRLRYVNGAYNYNNTCPPYVMHINDNLTEGKHYYPLTTKLMDFTTDFGVHARWIGWTMQDGVKAAKIRVIFQPDTAPVPIDTKDLSQVKEIK